MISTQPKRSVRQQSYAVRTPEVGHGFMHSEHIQNYCELKKKKDKAQNTL